MTRSPEMRTFLKRKAMSCVVVSGVPAIHLPLHYRSEGRDKGEHLRGVHTGVPAKGFGGLEFAKDKRFSPQHHPTASLSCSLLSSSFPASSLRYLRTCGVCRSNHGSGSGERFHHELMTEAAITEALKDFGPAVRRRLMRHLRKLEEADNLTPPPSVRASPNAPASSLHESTITTMAAPSSYPTSASSASSSSHQTPHISRDNPPPQHPSSFPPPGKRPPSASGEFTQSDEADWYFRDVDEDRDGWISRPEFRRLYQRVIVPTITREATLSRQLVELQRLNRQYLKSAVAPCSENEMDSSSHLHPLTTRQVFLVLIKAMLPYVGFGFCDNVLMLLAGEYIDKTVGVAFCLSTMASAGMGNTVSCALAVVTGGAIERMSHSIGLPTPDLTPVQVASDTVRGLHIGGSVIGVILGCVLGMTPLLFLPSSARGAAGGQGGEIAETEGNDKADDDNRTQRS